MKNIYQKMFVFAVLVLGFSVANVAFAMAPNLSLSANSNNTVSLTVNGDANSSVYLNYNLSYGMQNSHLGMTNNYGYFSTTISQNSYNLTSGSLVYVTVNGQSSQSQSWPSYGNYNCGSNCYQYQNSPLVVSSLTLPVGSTAVLNSANGQAITVNSNSNGSVVSTGNNLSGGVLPAGCNGGQYSYLNGQYCNYNTSYNYNINTNSSALQLTALAVGTSNLTVCSNYYNGYNNSNNCTTLTVNVTGANYAYNTNYTGYTTTGSVLGACYVGVTLRPGASGGDVSCLQTTLQSLGFLSAGYQNGYYDGVTLSAVLSFQRSRGLYADGIVGRNTRNQLFGYNY